MIRSLLALVIACAPPVAAGPSDPVTVAPSPSRSAAPASSIVPPSPSPTPTRTPEPPPTSATTFAPTPSPSQSGGAPYCAVDDVLTPERDYARSERTALDWTYALPDSYAPPDLVSALSGQPMPSLRAVEAVGAADVLARRGDPRYGTLLSDARDAAIRRIVFDDLSALRAAAQEAGRPLIVISAFRSYNLQRLTFEYWVGVGGYERALRTSARPGHSEHQLGTALDFGDGSAAPWEYADWATTPIGAWIAEHAAEYGFVLSYPKGRSAVTCYDYEPWHYRWVGRALAQQLVAAAVTLREHQAGLPR